MTEEETKYLNKMADDFLYGPRMLGHAKFRHFALMKVQEIYKAGKSAGKAEAEKKE